MVIALATGACAGAGGLLLAFALGRVGAKAREASELLRTRPPPLAGPAPRGALAPGRRPPPGSRPPLRPVA